MQSSHILYIAQALESMFFYMCFKILYSFKMFFKMSFHAHMPFFFTGDSQITTTLCPTTSQEGAWSRFWWLTQYCYVGTQVMTLSTISHMDPWTWIKLTTSWPGSLRAWKTAGTPDLIIPAHCVHSLFLLCLWTSKWLVTVCWLQHGTHISGLMRYVVFPAQWSFKLECLSSCHLSQII